MRTTRRRGTEIRLLDDITWEEYTPAPRSAKRVSGLLVAMLGASLTLGVVAGLLTMPAVVASSLGVRAAGDFYARMPVALTEPRLPQQSVMLDVAGNQFARLLPYDRTPVTLDAISDPMRRTVVAVEDARFYTHHGVDPVGVLRAAYANATGDGGLQGASTITQQYIKNVLVMADDLGYTDEVAADGAEVSAVRKIREMKLAAAAERDLTKDEILVKYLNIAYFGNGAYGVEAAARRYFSVPAARLTWSQAAVLTSLLKNPNGYDPLVHPGVMRERRAVVATRLAAAGVLTDDQAAKITRKGLGLNPSRPTHGCHVSKYPFYCAEVLSRLRTDPAFGATQSDRDRLLTTGGLVVTTALDPKAMDAVERSAKATIPADHRVATAVAMIKPGTGHVAAIGTNRNFGSGSADQTEIVLPVNAQFQPGSTFKLFTLAAALEGGMSMYDTVPGGASYVSRTLKNPPKGYFSNSAGSLTNPTLVQATQMSMNTAFVQLEERVGVLKVAEMAHRLGVKSVSDTGPSAPLPVDGSFTLGTASVSVLEMASAYATIAGSGERCEPVFITAVTFGDRTRLPVPDQGCEQVLDSAAADTAAHVLGAVVSAGTGAPAQFGRPAAGKTGTTENLGAAWFAGFTPQYATAVWVGDPRGGSAHPLYDVLGYSRVYGGTLPASVWRGSMAAVHQGLPVRRLPAPDSSYLVRPASGLMASVVGLRFEQARNRVQVAGGTVTKVKKVDAGPGQRPGMVVAQTPAAGVRAQGARVTLSVTR